LPERSRNATTGTNYRAEIKNSPIQPSDSVDRGLEPLADVSLFNLALLALGIDDPDARRGNDQVVDVRPATGNPSVVEHDGSVSNGAHKVGRQLSFPL
jgi:hypothetical protein